MRYWKYQLYGLLGLCGGILLLKLLWDGSIALLVSDLGQEEASRFRFFIFFTKLVLSGLFLVMVYYILWVLLLQQSLIRLFFGDNNQRDILSSFYQGSWKKDYQSPYHSKLAFLLFDPYGQRIAHYRIPGTLPSLLSSYVPFRFEGFEEWKAVPNAPEVEIRYCRTDDGNWIMESRLSTTSASLN
ncbi:MAG: hypothetical protein Q4B28_03535 [bacterium]|nr:hypothetical protein [bacterium]